MGNKMELVESQDMDVKKSRHVCGCCYQTMKLYLLISSFVYMSVRCFWCYCIFIVCYLLWHFGIVTFL